jgi:hypothetical protein
MTAPSRPTRSAAATLQKAASKENPVLIRIETKSGHGASNVHEADQSPPPTSTRSSWPSWDSPRVEQLARRFAGRRSRGLQVRAAAALQEAPFGGFSAR